MLKRQFRKKLIYSIETIKRLSVYLKNLKRIDEQNISIISSVQITQFLNATPVQFRKDLSYFGGFGKRGVGYNVKQLIKEIEKILGINKQQKIILVGAGKLGSALLSFKGFSKFNLKISYVLDSDKNKIGKTKEGIKIEDVKNILNILKHTDVKIAVLSTPPEVAQDIADELIASGIKGILNFTPVILKAPEYVSISNVDMACELESLIFFAKQKKDY